jgi:hypothetical protein
VPPFVVQDQRRRHKRLFFGHHQPRRRDPRNAHHCAPQHPEARPRARYRLQVLHLLLDLRLDRCHALRLGKRILADPARIVLVCHVDRHLRQRCCIPLGTAGRQGQIPGGTGARVRRVQAQAARRRARLARAPGGARPRVCPRSLTLDFRCRFASPPSSPPPGAAAAASAVSVLVPQRERFLGAAASPAGSTGAPGAAGGWPSAAVPLASTMSPPPVTLPATAGCLREKSGSGGGRMTTTKNRVFVFCVLRYITHFTVRHVAWPTNNMRGTHKSIGRGDRSSRAAITERGPGTAAQLEAKGLGDAFPRATASPPTGTPAEVGRVAFRAECKSGRASNACSN